MYLDILRNKHIYPPAQIRILQKMRKVKKDIFKNTTKRISKEMLTGEMHYKTTYKDIHKFFNIFNKALFKNKLIPFNNVKIRKMYKTWGQFVEVFNNRKKTISYELEMLPEYPNKKEFLSTLAHECIHYSQILLKKGNVAHNRYFYSFKSKFKKLNLHLN